MLKTFRLSRNYPAGHAVVRPTADQRRSGRQAGTRTYANWQTTNVTNNPAGAGLNTTMTAASNRHVPANFTTPSASSLCGDRSRAARHAMNPAGKVTHNPPRSAAVPS